MCQLRRWTINCVSLERHELRTNHMTTPKLISYYTTLLTSQTDTSQCTANKTAIHVFNII